MKDFLSIILAIIIYLYVLPFSLSAIGVWSTCILMAMFVSFSGLALAIKENDIDNIDTLNMAIIVWIILIIMTMFVVGVTYYFSPEIAFMALTYSLSDGFLTDLNL